jgi:hypothetical protein
VAETDADNIEARLGERHRQRQTRIPEVDARMSHDDPVVERECGRLVQAHGGSG